MIYADKNNKKIHADLLYADLTYKIRGAIFQVYNELGFGHKEQVYQKALTNEFNLLGIPFTREMSLSVSYKGEKVGNYRLDFVVDNKIIIELKAVDVVPKTFETQLINYLKATDHQLGLLVNFGGQKLYLKRLINSYPRKSEIIRENQLPPKVAERR